MSLLLRDLKVGKKVAVYNYGNMSTNRSDSRGIIISNHDKFKVKYIEDN